MFSVLGIIVKVVLNITVSIQLDRIVLSIVLILTIFLQGSFHSNSYNSGSADISHYCDKSMLEDPWAELEERVRKINEPVVVDMESSSSSSDDEMDNQEETGSGVSNDGEDDGDVGDDDNDGTAADNTDDSPS